MDPLEQWSLLELSQALAARRIGAVELMQMVLERMEQTDTALSAVVSRREPDELLGAAREADARIGRGEGRPLEGIPAGIKDLSDVAGMVTTQGSLLFREQVATRDALDVARLKRAGAIVVAKTNTPEFGLTAITKNLVRGTTCNPWNLQRSPGGSSGGSAALLAAGVLPLATASDGGGSIRIPASWTGLFGLKTSYGRIPFDLESGWHANMRGVLGPLTKTVQDAAWLLDQQAGPSPSDPSALPAPGHRYLDKVSEPSGALRIAVSPDFGRVPVQPDVAVAVERAARWFERQGHRLIPVGDGPPAAGQSWLATAGWPHAGELAQTISERREELTHLAQRVIDLANGLDAVAWAGIRRERGATCAWSARVFERADVLITPTTPFEAAPAGGPFPSEIAGQPLEPASVGAFTIPFNLTWQPAASVPVGFAKSGLPIGMQLVAPVHREDLLLQLAHSYEREHPWHPNWPVVPSG